MAVETQKIQENIQQILWGKSFADVVDYIGEEHTFILRSLTIKESNFLNFLYNRELKNAQREGVLSYDQLKLLFQSQGIWGPEEKKEKENLERQQIMLKVQIKDAQFHTVKKKKLNKMLKEVEGKIKEINDMELSLFSVTAEQRAEECKRRYMVMMFTEDMYEQSYWRNEKSFMMSTDAILLVNLIVAYYKNNIYDEKKLRQIARSPEWRFRWLAAKHGENLFGRSIAEWSEMQNMVVYWSEFYDSIYDSMERPSEYIIEDDAACDAWMKDQGKKAATGATDSKKKNIYGHKRAKQNLNHSEHFVMVPRGDQEAVQKVQDMNPESIRSRLRNEYEQIKKGGGKRIKEWDLGNRRGETPIITGKRKGR